MEANNLQVRWKHHQMGVMDYLRQLLVSEVFVDVTLCCQTKRFKAHRILLSACSTYLQQVLVEHLTSDHVTIILPDIHPEDMQWLLDFMYTGSVAVPKCRLTSFLQAAEALHIKVLTDMAQLHKESESDSVLCIPACSPSLDIKLANLQSNILSPNLDSHTIKADNSNEDVKLSCGDATKISNDSSRLLNNKVESRNLVEDRKNCMFKCLNNPSFPASSVQNVLQNKSVACKGPFNASSLYGGLSKITELHDGTKKEKLADNEDCSSGGVVMANSRCTTKIVHNTVDGNNKTLGCSSENAVIPFMEKPLHNETSCDPKDVAENLISKNNTSYSCSNNNKSKLVKIPETETDYSIDRITSGDGRPSPEYGLHLDSTSDLQIIPKENNNNIISDARGMLLRSPHESYQPDNTEHYSQQIVQRLSQWPKPIPSLMPISNNNYHYNGQIPPGYFNKDGRINGVMSYHQQKDPRAMNGKESLPEHLQNIKDIIPNIGNPYQTCNVPAAQNFLKDNLCMRGVWLSGRNKTMHLNGQRPTPDGRPTSRRLLQRVPRLSPIVPPSPWAQNHRPPCAAPVICPPIGAPIGFNYQSANWLTSKQTFVGLEGAYQKTSPSGHRQQPNDLTRSSSTPVPNTNTTGNAVRSPSPSSKCLKRPEIITSVNNNIAHDHTMLARKRTSDNMDVFCKLKERRLQDFYREQMSIKLRNEGHISQEKEDEVSDLSTKSSHSPIRSPHSNSARSSPSEYQSFVNSPTHATMSLQSKIQTNDLSSPKISVSDDRSLYKENLKTDDSTKISNICDIDDSRVEIKLEEMSSNEDKSDINQTSLDQNGERQNYIRGEEDDEEVQILNGARTSKNDNNNNNGVAEDPAQSVPVNKNHGCEDCGKCFSRRQLLVQHRRIHTGERPYSCADCGRQFTQRGHWSTHQKLHEPARRPEHACPSCGKAFVTRASLKVHLRTHTGEKPFQCGECGKQFSQLRNYKYHRSVHEGTREFAATCPECGKYFNDRGYLSSHMKIHRNRKEYGCQYCGKSFNQRVAYNMHVRIHTGERPHSCPHCNKSFSRKMLLKQHLRIHTGEKPFACSVCGKAFADRSNMTLHMRLHSGIKPYSCQLCAKAFTKKHHLKTHLNYHTGTKPYSCSKCGLRFSQSSNMRTHYKKCTSTGPVSVDAPVNNTDMTTTPVTEGNGVTSPSSSDVTVRSPRSSAAVITPPHSDESSCGSSVISRNAIEAQPA